MLKYTDTDILDFLAQVCQSASDTLRLNAITGEYSDPDTHIRNFQGYAVPYTPCDMHYYTGVSAKLHDVDISRVGIMTACGTDTVWLSSAEVDCPTWQEGIAVIKKWLSADVSDYLTTDILGIYGDTIDLGSAEDVRDYYEGCEDEEDYGDDVPYGCKEDAELPWWYKTFTDTFNIPMKVATFFDNIDTYKDTNICVGISSESGDRTWLSLYKTGNNWTVAYYYPFA